METERQTRPDRRALVQGALGLGGLWLTACRTPAPVHVRLRPDPAPPAEPDPVPRGVLRLPAPDLSSERVVAYVAGIRPYRSRGPRVESERRFGKQLIHDYGHGGSGWTLAFGCARDVAELVEGTQDCLVIGGGIVGLSCALTLRRAGHGVRVLAASYPPDTTSNVAGGQFAPSLVGRVPRDDMQRWLRASYEALSPLEGREWGVEAVDNYATRGSGGGLRRLPRDLLGPVRELDTLPLGGRPRSGFVARTLFMQPPRFLERLMEELRSLGVLLETGRLESLEELEQQPEPVVALCTGLGTRDLVEDHGLRPIRGQLVHLEPQDLGYSLSNNGYLFSRPDVLVVGGTAERDRDTPEASERTCRSLLGRQRAFFAVGS